MAKLIHILVKRGDILYYYKILKVLLLFKELHYKQFSRHFGKIENVLTQQYLNTLLSYTVLLSHALLCNHKIVKKPNIPK